MTNEERKVIKLALEALTATMATHGFKDAIDDVHDKAITAIKEALAQPEQEPVAYCWKSLSTGDLFDFVENKNGDALKEQDEDFPTSNLILLYTTPPQRKPLTDEQKYALIEKHLGLKQRRDNTVIDQYTGLFYSAKPYFDLINEAAHGIKE